MNLYVNNKGNASSILTWDNDPTHILGTKCVPLEIDKNGLAKAAEINDKLRQSLKPYMPAAGLAAPQIGISKSIFIYSWDRSEENLITVLNPGFESLDHKTEVSWEACFSILNGQPPYKISKNKRYSGIRAYFINLEGHKVQMILQGFGARVFQHEMDHLNGLEHIHQGNPEIKEFLNKEELYTFLKEVKSTDQTHYEPPLIKDIK